MPSLPVPVAATVLIALLAGSAPAESGVRSGPVQLAQLIFQQRVTVRVPQIRTMAPTAWEEKRGPKCIPLGSLAGALVNRADSVDLVQTGGARLRARLDDDCPALAFYSGLYIRPTADGQICAGRDAVRSRAGRVCRIDKFRKLVPKQ